MDTQIVEEVIECLNDERRLLHYYKDRYAIYYLEKLVQQYNEVSVSELKTAKWARILHKPIVKELLAICGNGLITRQQVEQFFPMQFESFVLTLSQWGEAEDYPWEQTSRPGTNLVLQLNFTNEHDQWLSEKNIDRELFTNMWHPVHEQKSSLAWARIDFDFDTNEALVEEVQNDWLRGVMNHHQWSKQTIASDKAEYLYDGILYCAKTMLDYTQLVIKKYAKIWSETMLYSAVKFIREELGFNKIFYHTVETGSCLKNIEDAFPPISIYSDLPRKLCFEMVDDGPEFIMNCGKIKRRVNKIRDKQWFYLEL